jgi:hypothetical protein
MFIALQICVTLANVFQAPTLRIRGHWRETKRLHLNDVGIEGFEFCAFKLSLLKKHKVSSILELFL